MATGHSSMRFVPVSCFMYRCEEAKACDKWSTYVKIELNESLVHLRKRFAINDYGGFKTKAAEKGIGKLDFLLGVKHKKPDPPEFPNGRLYMATTEDEWAIYKEFLFGIEGKEYELVGRSIFDLSDQIKDKGKIFSARLHYPVDVTEVVSGLNNPVGIAFKAGLLLIAELGEK